MQQQFNTAFRRAVTKEITSCQKASAKTRKFLNQPGLHEAKSITRKKIKSGEERNINIKGRGQSSETIGDDKFTMGIFLIT